MTVIPTTAPQDEATTELVSALRDDVIPEAAGSELDVKVTGMAAVQNDVTNYLSQRMPVFFAAVLILSFVLLAMVFRSLLVPIKAVIMNMLSIAGAYGAVVAVFQWGWAGELLGIEGAPVNPFIPMMLFAVVFGLSMDYEVFLLSRVREEFVRTGDSPRSVADGLASTARVITAAAAIMVVVFGSFMFEDIREVKLFGLGLGLAVLLDATLVRMLLVPATMELLGDRNWWMPSWLDRLLPRIHVEGGGDASLTAPTPVDAESPALRGGRKVEVEAFEHRRQPVLAPLDGGAPVERGRLLGEADLGARRRGAQAPAHNGDGQRPVAGVGQPSGVDHALVVDDPLVADRSGQAGIVAGPVDEPVDTTGPEVV
jgi:RND superfamily putative drug exporter